MSSPRASGVLLHPTSLPGPFGVGDLGTEAFTFVDFLAGSGQTYWQTLPLGPAGAGDSPYSAFSAFAGNTLLISPEKLVGDALLDIGEISFASKSNGKSAECGSVEKWKHDLIENAFERFQGGNYREIRGKYEGFTHENAWWLDDYAMFIAVKRSNGGLPWFKWAEDLKYGHGPVFEESRHQLARQISIEKFAQFLFWRQWSAIRKYANEKNIKTIGDLPIFVALDSADVWCNKPIFKLGTGGQPTVVAGVPPDYFSKTGQRWGNPIYDWDAMRRDNFNWWTARVAFAFRMFDVVRLDHFIGFVRNWEIPAKDVTAENGQWADVPGWDLFETLQRRLGSLPMIAEDLGSLTPAVEQLRDAFGFPGMRVLQYGFGGDANNRDLPHNYVKNSVVYTGTHDNDTTVGWYRNLPGNARKHFRAYFRSNGREPNWDMIRGGYSSNADTVIIPLQDILGLDSRSRMNTPSTKNGNWKWRMAEGELSHDLEKRLYELTKLYGRLVSSQTD